jgi:hypothetical protein
MAATPPQRRIPSLDEQLLTEFRIMRETLREIAVTVQAIAKDVKTLTQQPK